MMSKVGKEIIKKLSNKYNIPMADIDDMIKRFYAGVVYYMEQSEVRKGKLLQIMINGFGKFRVKNYHAVKMMMELNLNRLKEMYTDRYSIVMQGEPQIHVENNEPFFFLADKNMPSLEKGRHIAFFYTKEKREMLIEGKILDAKHPFYQVAMYLEEEETDEKPEVFMNFRRDRLKEIAI